MAMLHFIWGKALDTDVSLARWLVEGTAELSVPGVRVPFGKAANLASGQEGGWVWERRRGEASQEGGEGGERKEREKEKKVEMDVAQMTSEQQEPVDGMSRKDPCALAAKGVSLKKAVSGPSLVGSKMLGVFKMVPWTRWSLSLDLVKTLGGFPFPLDIIQGEVANVNSENMSIRSPRALSKEGYPALPYSVAWNSNLVKH